ncbi:MAG: S8 family serine peptidase [Bacteroidaceae bacterium]|nr:S8 family serine peptidase [Bacteroidaceae bacterium]
MKHFTSLFLFLVFPLVSTFPQTSDNEDHVVKIDPANVRAYRSGQMLVKFKDESSISVRRNAPGRFQISSNKIRALSERIGVTDMEQLMPIGGKMKISPARRLRSSLTGKPIEDRDLSKLYLVKFNEQRTPNVLEAVAAFEENEDVEFAEPNYLVFALGTPTPTHHAYSTSEKHSDHRLTDGSATPAAFTPTDPLYQQQWGPSAIRLPEFWAKETQNVLGRRPVIAILDTGVDITHPDLKDNIWTNEKELNGVEGEDDDLDGYVDDLHGWDCVNQTGRLGDWNGHGTHCAGIAAAVANNGIGIVGANPDALIMPVTVLQSDGGGDVGTIIRGLEYTMKHDVDVISMSLGGYGYSKAEEMALGKCYNRSVIVAAAGNDGLCIYPGHSCCSKPMFPGAFTFVLGVEASKDHAGVYYSLCGHGAYPFNANPWRACFSNLDDDGPVYTDLAIFDEEKLYNYELMVPGTDILSTYPKGRYVTLNGTSMATPLAAGAISRLLETKEYSSKELLFGDLIGSADKDSKIMDVMAAYNITDADRKPTLWFVNYAMQDSLNGDNDGRFDAGETIELFPIMRNSWGEAVGIKCSLATAENEDPEIIEIIDNDIDFGRTLHSYGKEHSVNPIRFKINNNCVDGRRIRLTLSSTCENGTGETIHQDFTITVENGEELGGILAKNTTLEAGKHYIITKSLAIPNGITLTIPPGTTIKFHDNAMLVVAERARIRAIGTPDQPIIFTKGDLSLGYVPTLSFNSLCQFQYCQFTMLSAESNLITGGRFTDCIFKDCDFGYFGNTGLTTTRCNIMDNMGYVGYDYGNNHTNTNIIGNITTNINCPPGYCPGYNTQWADVKACNVYGNYSNYLRRYANIHCVDLEPTVVYSDYPSYLGTAQKEVAGATVMDYYNDANDDVLFTSFAAVDLTNMLTKPSSEAHGIVWKILVDGIDAQDEYDQIPPLGVGTHRVDVYFNRPMDTSVQPWLSMGVRPPYTQTLINENASWNEDGTIYTAYLPITAKSAFDGINRFYVADAQDLDHFVIPTDYYRFNVPVGAAGSKSTGFMAEAGLGRVKLTWQSLDPEEVEDVMGYNMYRYTINEDGTASDTILVNQSIIEEEGGDGVEFTDYDVTPGTTYYYYYRALRTTLDSTEPSLTVASTPLTAAKGDANGSMEVNVADVVTEIAYLTDQNPQPFIFEAADVNSDEIVNILDVVGTINIILPSSASASSAQGLATAEYSIEDGLLYIDTPVQLAGLQLFLSGCESADEVTPLAALDGMEYATSSLNTKLSTLNFLTYSLARRTIPAGRHAILRVGNARVSDIILSDLQGRQVQVQYQLPTIVEEMENEYVNRQLSIGTFFDLTGRRVKVPNKGIYIINGKKTAF